MTGLRFLILICLLSGGCVVSDFREEAAPSSEAAVQRVVGPDDFDDALLSAAIFAETNRERREQGLRPLRPYANLRNAADIQAFTNAITGVVTHDNPIAGHARAWDRVRAQGIDPAIVMENVLVTLVRSSGAGKPVRVERREGDSQVRRDDETGAVLPWPTYAELAQRVVAQWMDSPVHRINILNAEVRYLACGVAMSRTPLGGELLHATQVFMAKASN